MASMASRSSADATRFTAAQPHAYSQPNTGRSSTPSISSPDMKTTSQKFSNSSTSIPPPQGFNGSSDQKSSETPKEKLARLRAARLAQRQVQLTTWERTVIRGRVWADRIHRVTATSLMLFSVVMLGVTGFAAVDMVLHNRQKRAAFMKAQHEIYQARVITAIETEKAGLPLEEHQILVLARERALVKAEERKKQLSWFKRLRIKFSTSTKDLDPIVVPSEREMLDKLGVTNAGVLEASEGRATVNSRGEIEGMEETELVKAVRRKREEMGLEEKSETAKMVPGIEERQSGTLDSLGTQSPPKANLATSKFSGWLPWGK